MTYIEFLSAVQEYICHNEKWKDHECKFFAKGFSNNEDREDREFVYATNIKYYSVESDVLMGDFIILNIGNSSKYTTSCRFSVKYLYEEFQKGSWEMVYRIMNKKLYPPFEMGAEVKQ